MLEIVQKSGNHFEVFFVQCARVLRAIVTIQVFFAPLALLFQNQDSVLNGKEEKTVEKLKKAIATIKRVSISEEYNAPDNKPIKVQVVPVISKTNILFSFLINR